MQSDGQREKTVSLERVVKAGRNGANIWVEVVDTARANVGDIHQRGSAKDSLTVTSQSKLLLADAGWDLEEVGSGVALERLSGAARRDRDTTGSLEKCGNIDGIIHSLPTIRASHKVIATSIVGWAVRGGVGGVAVQCLQVAAVPVNKLLILNILGDVGIPVLICGDKRL